MEFAKYTILGSDESRVDTWKTVEENLLALYNRYSEDNDRRLEKALIAFANIVLLGLALFILDRISDWTCDWWSKTCADMSKVMLTAYVGIFLYVGVQCYF